MTSDVTSPRRSFAIGFGAHPAGLSGLYFTELWERFSYYGMRALLTLFMVAPIASGGLGFAVQDAGRIYGTYTMAVYMLAIPGGFIADRILGAKRSVLLGGIIIALGHFLLAAPALSTFYAGLICIAFGTGLFKPNISALVGALYARGDERRDAGFSLFYMGINIGAFLAPIVTGFLAQSDLFKRWLANAGFDPTKSWHWGFAAAGVGMTIAMLLFARHMRSLNNPDPVEQSSTFGRDGLRITIGTLALFALALASDVEGLTWLRWLFILLPVAAVVYAASRPEADAKRLAAIGIFFIAAMIFWAIFEQAGTTLSLFADQLTRTNVAGVPFPSSWFQSLNPIFVILLTPLIAGIWIKLSYNQPNSAVKFALGLFFLSTSFLLMVPAATLASEGRVSPLWLVGLYFLFTVGELMLSPVGLSAMTQLAPKQTTGLVLGIWFLAAALGNKVAGIIGSSFSATDPDGMALSFLSQAGLVAVAAALMLALAPMVKRLSDGER